MTILDRIKADHDTHRELMKEILQTEGDSASRRHLFSQLKADVTAHANAEEQAFYSKLMKNPDSQEKARHSVHEHEQADDLFEELAEMDMGSTGWLNRFKTLQDELEHHMEEEEEEVFALAKRVFSSKQLEQMQADFQQRKQAEWADQKAA